METYFPAHQGQSSFGLIRDDDMLWLSYRINDPQIGRRQDAASSMGMFLNVFRHALGLWCPLEIRFEHANPESHQEHEALFGAPDPVWPPHKRPRLPTG